MLHRKSQLVQASGEFDLVSVRATKLYLHRRTLYMYMGVYIHIRIHVHIHYHLFLLPKALERKHIRVYRLAKLYIYIYLYIYRQLYR